MRNGWRHVSTKEQVSFRIIEDDRTGKLSRKEAAVSWGSERAATRQTKKIREQGLREVKHGNCGKRPANVLPAQIKQEMLRLAADVYPDFNLRHRLEMIEMEHGLRVSYGTFYCWCRLPTILARPKRGPHRRRVPGTGPYGRWSVRATCRWSAR